MDGINGPVVEGVDNANEVVAAVESIHRFRRGAGGGVFDEDEDKDDILGTISSS